MPDISLSVDTSFVQMLFSAVNYPWRKRIDGDRMLTSDDEEIPFEVLGQGGDEDDAGGGDEYLNELIETYLSHKGDPRNQGSAEEALHKLLEPYRQAGDDKSSIRSALLNDPKGGDKIETFLRALRGGVTLDWIEFELSQKPNSHLGNPLALTNLKIAVRAKAKLCARIFGRERCISITTPWSRFEGERVEVALIEDGLKIKARAKARNVDFTVKVKIGPFTFTFRIGVTSHINRYLEKNSPVLVDASDIRIKIPGLDLTYRPVALDVPSSGTETTVSADGSFSR